MVSSLLFRGCPLRSFIANILLSYKFFSLFVLGLQQTIRFFYLVEVIVQPH